MKQQIFNYRILESVYKEIKAGIKTTEFRLLNDKSKKIQNGDLIKFIVVDHKNKFINVEVIDKFIYNNIDELWEDKNVTFNNTLNCTKQEFFEMLCNIFGKENVEISKIVGIKFKLIN